MNTARTIKDFEQDNNVLLFTRDQQKVVEHEYPHQYGDNTIYSTSRDVMETVTVTGFKFFLPQGCAIIGSIPDVKLCECYEQREDLDETFHDDVLAAIRAKCGAINYELIG